MARRIALIVNPAAGGGRAAGLIGPVEAALRAGGETVTTRPTRSLDHARELAVAAHAAGELPVTLSGDGLIGAVTGALAQLAADARPLLGVLPGGRGNDFVRAAGISRDAVEACATILRGVPTLVDLGDVDGRPFVGIASLGFDSDANRIANAAPPRLGRLVYAYGAIRALAAWHHAAFTVTVDDRPARTFSGWSVAAANGPAYGGGMFLAPDASLTDGALDVVLSHACSKRAFFATLPRVFKGTHVERDTFEVLRGRCVRVAADRPFVVYADGDPIGELPATISVRPGAVRILLPA